MSLPARVIVIIAVNATVALPASAQTDTTQATPVMKQSEISAGALIDALDPTIPKQRSFSRDPQASLLIEFRTNSMQLTGEAKEKLAIVGRALNAPQLAGTASSSKATPIRAAAPTRIRSSPKDAPRACAYTSSRAGRSMAGA